MLCEIPCLYATVVPLVHTAIRNFGILIPNPEVRFKYLDRDPDGSFYFKKDPLVRGTDPDLSIVKQK
jgi:hypothetical protein